MKKNILSVIALILALVSLAFGWMTLSLALDMAEQYESQLVWMAERSASLESRLAELEFRLGALETQSDVPLPSEPAPTEAPAENTAYCNLIIGDWTFEDGELTVSTAFAQALAENTNLESAVIVLQVNGEPCTAIPIDMAPGEASDSYELDLFDLDLEMPSLADGDTVELLLIITLSDGRVLTSCGGNWEYLEESLMMIAG